MVEKAFIFHPFLGIDGAERVAISIAKVFKELGFQVELYTTEDSRDIVDKAWRLLNNDISLQLKASPF